MAQQQSNRCGRASHSVRALKGLHLHGLHGAVAPATVGRVSHFDLVPDAVLVHLLLEPDEKIKKQKKRTEASEPKEEGGGVRR
jgi:hypothetical protein